MSVTTIKNNNTIQVLPSEVLCKIFTYTNPFTIRGVCRTWESILSDNFIYKEIFSRISGPYKLQLKIQIKSIQQNPEVTDPHYELMRNIFLETCGLPGASKHDSLSTMISKTADSVLSQLKVFKAIFETSKIHFASEDNSLYGQCDAARQLLQQQDVIIKLLNFGYFTLINNQLTTIPHEIGSLSNLRTLCLDNNKLTTIPHEIGSLSNLRILCLDNNKLTTIPHEIGSLSNLRTLSLHNNKLTTIPPEIFRLSKLEFFFIDNNKLTTIPPEIFRLSKLKSFFINNNQLTDLPPALCRLTQLSALMIGLSFRHISLSHLELGVITKDGARIYIGEIKSKEEIALQLKVRTAGPLNVLHDVLYRLQYPQYWQGKPITVDDFKSLFTEINVKLLSSDTCFMDAVQKRLGQMDFLSNPEKLENAIKEELLARLDKLYPENSPGRESIRYFIWNFYRRPMDYNGNFGKDFELADLGVLNLALNSLPPQCKK